MTYNVNDQLCYLFFDLYQPNPPIVLWEKDKHPSSNTPCLIHLLTINSIWTIRPVDKQLPPLPSVLRHDREAEFIFSGINCIPFQCLLIIFVNRNTPVQNANVRMACLLQKRQRYKFSVTIRS